LKASRPQLSSHAPLFPFLKFPAPVAPPSRGISFPKRHGASPPFYDPGHLLARAHFLLTQSIISLSPDLGLGGTKIPTFLTLSLVIRPSEKWQTWSPLSSQAVTITGVVGNLAAFWLASDSKFGGKLKIVPAMNKKELLSMGILLHWIGTSLMFRLAKNMHKCQLSFHPKTHILSNKKAPLGGKIENYLLGFC
jgi:hypothetical protein